MLPISDEAFDRKQLPVLTIMIIVANALVFLYQLTLGDAALQRFIFQYGVTPIEITTGRDISPTIPYPVWVTLFTSMFLHGGWMHILGNMLYLWVFGDNVEDRLGHIQFLLFYLVCGLAAVGLQVFPNPTSREPTIGASGAIAGVLGGYLLLYPSRRVNVLIIFGFFIRMAQFPAMLVLGFWFVLQLFNSLLGAGGGVAYWAHVGGFVTGMLLVAPFALRDRRERSRSSDPWSFS